MLVQDRMSDICIRAPPSLEMASTPDRCLSDVRVRAIPPGGFATHNPPTTKRAGGGFGNVTAMQTRRGLLRSANRKLNAGKKNET